jgi:hypothetical protein
MYSEEKSTFVDGSFSGRLLLAAGVVLTRMMVQTSFQSVCVIGIIRGNKRFL